MNSENSERNDAPLDRELARRFARLKEQDRRYMPPPPSESELAAARSARARLARAKPAMGLAAAVLLCLGVTLLALKPTGDPAELYLAIMQKQSVTTDSLLRPSPTVLPESDLLPEFYQMNFYEGSNE